MPTTNPSSNDPRRTRSWHLCAICGRDTCAKDEICDRTGQCRSARRVLRDFRRRGRPRIAPASEVRALLLNTTMALRELAMMLGYGEKTISRCAQRRCMLSRRWRIEDPPLYYPGEGNWRQCRAAAFLRAHPTESLTKIAQRIGVQPNTLMYDINKLGAQRIWCEAAPQP